VLIYINIQTFNKQIYYYCFYLSTFFSTITPLYSIDALADINTICEPQCVNHVKNNLPENSKWKNIKIGSAKNWWELEDDIYKKGNKPRVKSIIIYDEWQNNEYGHAGIVVDIRGDSLLINHSNWIFVKGKRCNITTNWFLLKRDMDDSISVIRNNNTYPVLGFIYAWNTQVNANISSYKRIVIGEQTWMAENLRESNYRNGDVIKHARTNDEWKNAWWNEQGAWCYVNNDPSTEKIFGKLYNWYAVNDPRGLAPKGWHIPSDKEWFTLEENVGLKGGYHGYTYGYGALNRAASHIAGKLKSEDMRYWKHPSNASTNESGFSALPGGYRYVLGSFFDHGRAVKFWSSTRGYADFVIGRALWNNHSRIERSVFYNKGSGYSVRCVRD